MSVCVLCVCIVCVCVSHTVHITAVPRPHSAGGVRVCGPVTVTRDPVCAYT